MARPARVSPDQILNAAALEFAARGYAGARVDRIARRARVNKGMLYYHFRSKQALYRALLRQTFAGAAARVNAIADRPLPPSEKIDLAIAAVTQFVGEHAFFPAIMLREIAEGGQHLDRETFATLASLPQAIVRIIQQGVAERRVRPVHPLAAYLMILGPTVLFLAAAPIRRKLAGQFELTASLTLERFERELKEAMRLALVTPNTKD